MGIEDKALALMYVEDEPETRNLIADALAAEYPDIVLYTAENGSEAVEMFKQHQPQVVVTDIRMPVMDGLQMAEKIKGINPEVDLIALTAYSDTGFLLKAIKIGFSQYVLKPIDYDRLFGAINKSLSAIRSNINVQKQNEELRLLVAELEKRLEQRSAELEAARGELRRQTAELEEMTHKLNTGREDCSKHRDASRKNSS